MQGSERGRRKENPDRRNDYGQNVSLVKLFMRRNRANSSYCKKEAS